MRNHGAIRLLSMLLAMFLLPWLPAAASTESLPANLFTSELVEAGANVSSIAWMEDTLYILTNQGLYTWTEGTQGAVAVPGVLHSYQTSEDLEAPKLHALTTHLGQVLGLDANQGVLYSLAVQDGAAILTEKLQLDWSPFQQGDAQNPYVELPAFVTVIHGRLYVRVNNYENKAEDLFSYHLETGAMKVHAITHLFDIVPYKEGKLLALRFDQSKTDPQTMQPLPPDLVAIDPETDEAEVLALPLPPPGKYGWVGNVPLWYQEQKDAVYLLLSGRLQVLDAGGPKEVAVLPADNWANPSSPAIVPYRDELVFLMTGDNVFIRSTDSQKNPTFTTLSLNGNWYDGQVANQALLELGDVTLSVYDGAWMDNQALAAHLMTGSVSFDLLVLDTREYDIQQLVKKGYLENLSGSPSLSAFAEGALPTFQRIIRDGAGLYAIPIDIQSNTIEANTAYFEQLGQPIPHSVPELLALTRWWAEEGHLLHDDDALLGSSRATYQLKEIALRAYMDSMLGRGEPLSFDMEGFGTMMKEIDALDTEAWDLPVGYGSGDDDDIYIPNIMLNPYAGISLSGMQWQTGEPLVLAPDQQQPGYLSAIGRVLAVPARSGNKQAALRFIEAYVRSMPPVARASVSAAWETPIENPHYLQELERAQGTLAQYRALHDAAEDGPEKRQYAQDVAYFEKELDNFEQTRKYLVSAQQLQAYQALSQRMFVDDSLTQLQQRALSTDGYLFGMYLEGAITLEQFMEQANSKTRLMLLEAE